jgi:hypothetical protein
LLAKQTATPKSNARLESRRPQTRVILTHFGVSICIAWEMAPGHRNPVEDAPSVSGPHGGESPQNGRSARRAEAQLHGCPICPAQEAIPSKVSAQAF